MERQGDLSPVESSPILINPPFGYRDQPDFYNAVLLLRTPLSPRALLRRMLEAERRFGRRRSFPNAPRTLDLDLLFYEGRRIERPELQIPHPHWKERLSVTLPLAAMGELPPRLRRSALRRRGR
jgi:2-amino-4-hydroxy-6-hydroxymethyldihydropteridine diphosphokinase